MPNVLNLHFTRNTFLGPRKSRNNWPCGARKIHRRQGHLRRADGAFQKRAGAQHHHQTGLRQRQDLPVPQLSEASVLPGLQQREGRPPALRDLSHPHEPHPPRLLRGLPRPRYSHGHHAQRCSSHGWSTTAGGCQ